MEIRHFTLTTRIDRSSRRRACPHVGECGRAIGMGVKRNEDGGRVSAKRKAM